MRIVLVLALAALAGCAGAGTSRTAARSFERPDLDKLALRSLDVVVTTSTSSRFQFTASTSAPK